MFVVRTICNSKIVEMYNTYCKEADFEPLGRTLLYKTLNRVCSLEKNEPQRIGQHHCSRNRGVDMLEELVSTLRDAHILSYDLAYSIKAGLENYKLYLKTI